MDGLKIRAIKIAVYHKGDGVYPHAHDFYQMYHVISGVGRVKIGDRLIEMRPNRVIMIPPDEEHSVLEIHENAVRLINVQFFLNDVRLCEALEKAGASNYVSSTLINQLWKTKDEWDGLKHFSAEMAEALFTQYLVEYLRICGQTAEDRESTKLPLLDESSLDGVTRMVADYVRKNYSSSFTLQMMADDLSYSKNYICKSFKKSTGMTISNYTNRLRVAQAIELIRFTDKKLLEISTRVGFSDYHYFFRVFKEQTGFTPGEMRNRETLAIYLENQGEQRIQYRYFAKDNEKKKSGKR